MPKSPFKFLDSYTKEDKDIFFGREREIEEMYQKVFESKILLIYGISGTGKTSIINCGLANKFEDSDWLPITIRRGKNITESLVTELQKNAISPLLPPRRDTPPRGRHSNSHYASGGDTPTHIVKTLKSLYLDHFKPIYLIFDQFEEMFIFGDKNEREKFIRTVKEVVDSDVQCRFIFSIREEYLAGVTEFEQTITDFLSNRMRIEKMSWGNARKVIEEPCKAYDIEVEEGLAEKILGKLSPESTDVELTYLQVLLDKMYKIALENIQHSTSLPDRQAGNTQRSNDKSKEHSAEGIEKEKTTQLEFKISLLDKIGDVSDILGSFLEEQINLLKDPETGLVLLKSFVSAKGTKRQVILEDVTDFSKTLGKNIPKETLKELIIRFVNLRILRGRDESGRYELRHDSLAIKIYEKITLVEKELLEVRQFIENALYTYQKRSILLSVEDLEYIAPYESRMFLRGELNEFVQESKHQLTARKRWFKRILTYSAIGFFFIIVVIIVYSVQSSGNTKSRKYVLNAFLQNDFSSTLSFESALEAYERDTSSTYAIKTLFDSFNGLLEGGSYCDSLGNKLDPGKAIFDFTPCSSEIIYVDFSDDGQYIYGFLADSSIKVWTRKGFEILSQKVETTSVLSVKFSPNNKLITALFTDSTVFTWNMKGEIICSIKASYEPLNPRDVVNFHPGGNIFSCIGTNNDINIYDSSGKFLYRLEGHTAQVNAVDFSPNGRYIASGSKDSTIIVWKLDSLTGRYENATQISDFQDEVLSVDFAQNSKWILCTATDTAVLQPNVCYLCDFKGFKRPLVQAYYDTAYLNKDTVNYDHRITGKAISARFARNDAAIIIKSFGPGKISLDGNNEPAIDTKSINYLMRFSNNSQRNLMAETRAFRKYFWRLAYLRNENIHYYSGIDFSNQEYIAATISGRNHTILFHWDRLALVKFNGTNPVFSPDGNYLLCIEGTKLNLYPSYEKELIRLVEEERIFGELESNLRDWMDFINAKRE